MADLYARTRSKPTARSCHVENLNNWNATYPEAIDPNEQHNFVKERRGDLYTVVARAKSPLRLFLEKWRPLRFSYTLSVSERPDRAQASSTRYHSDTGLDIFTCMVVLVAGLCLIFGPMWWLSFVSKDSYRLGIITGFVTVFTVWLWASAGQRPFEMLAATAAYAAILMVFLQSNARLFEGTKALGNGASSLA